MPDDPTRSAAPGDTRSGAEPDPMSHPPASAASLRYELGSEIARGGMGVIHRATDTVLNREVAVKVLAGRFAPGSGAARRFADEARITAQLQHPAIPPVHDLGTLPDGRPFLAMKLIKGETLGELLKGGAAERGRFVATFEAVCQAVAFAHSKNVVHRDLKPANVMVGNFAEVQVMDWGLAKVLADARTDPDDPDSTTCGTEIRTQRDSDDQFTQAGSVLGTPAFMPPEQAIGAIDQIDARSDVFGLGGILCAILTGRPPFQGETAESTRQLAAKGKVQDCFSRLENCGADPELVALCKRCLAPEKDDRPADAGAVARAVAALRAAADERARHAELERVRLEGERSAEEARSAERRKRRRLAVSAAVLLALVVIAGLSVVLVVQRRANAALAAKQAKVEARFELAQKAVAKLHSGVSKDFLLQSDQFKELRTQLLKEAADFYADLEKLLDGETDPNSRRLLATGYFQLGELTWEIGSQSEALALHRKALAIRRELAAEPGASVETRLDVARSLGSLGYHLLWTDTGEALRAFAEQHDAAAAVEAESPTEAVRAILAQSHRNTGNALFDLGKSKEALAATERAAGLLQTLAADNPANPEYKYDLARSRLLTGMLLWVMGNGAEALAAYEDGAVILEKLAADHPLDTRFPYRLCQGHEDRAQDCLEDGKHAGAIAALAKSFRLSHKLADAHPAVSDFQSSVAIELSLLGPVLAEIGKPAEALTALHKALAIHEKLARNNPKDVWVQIDIALTRNRIGDLFALTGRPDDALQAHRKALAILRDLTPTQTALFSVQRELAVGLEKSGALLSAAGETEEGLKLCHEALAIRRKQSEAQPSGSELRAKVANGLCELGTSQRRAGSTPEAVTSFRRAVEMVEQLPPRSPREHYTEARGHALLAAVAGDPNSGLSAGQGGAEADKAVASLRRAIDAGFAGAARMRTDAAFTALRTRGDFQELLRAAEAKASGLPLFALPPAK